MTDRQDEQSPMSREQLVFELGRAQGMILRLLHTCELLMDEGSNAETSMWVKQDILEAREQHREVLNEFYGVRQSNEKTIERYHEALSDILSLFVFKEGWDFTLVEEALNVLAENMERFPTGAALVERIEQRKRET